MSKSNEMLSVDYDDLFGEPQLEAPSDLLDCDARVFGAAVVETFGVQRAGDAVNTKETREEIKQLRESAKILVTSENSVYKSAVNYLNATFAINDGEVASRELKTKYVQGKDVLAWLQKSSYKDIALFAEWNVNRQAAFQRAIVQDQPVLDADTIERTERMIDLGVFPKRALTRVEKSLGSFGVFYAMDSFEQGSQQAAGYCDNNMMAIANLYENKADLSGITPGMFNTAFHERLHGTGRPKGAFFTGVTKKKTMRWLEESTVEHATVVSGNVADPQVHTFMAADRMHDVSPGAYQNERILLGDLQQQDKADIPLDLLYEAFFSSGYSKSRREVEARLSRFFETVYPELGNSALYLFSENYEKAYHRNKSDDVLYEASSKILEDQNVEFLFEDIEMSSDGLTIFRELDT